jgi:hypothetical protein
LVGRAAVRAIRVFQNLPFEIAPQHIEEDVFSIIGARPVLKPAKVPG